MRSNKKHIPGGQVARMTPKQNLRPWTPEFWEKMKTLPMRPTEEDPGIVLTPDVLWALACEYFQGAGQDVMIKKDFIRSGESAGMIVDMPTERPFSWTSFELYVLYKGVRRSIQDIRLNRENQYNEFIPVIQQIDAVIYQQKFDGAAIGGYNPQLIIRDLGLAEKVDAKLQQEQPLFVDTPQAPVEE